jgi:hypothetical protein
VTRPGLRQTTVLYLEPKRAGTAVGCAVLAVILVAVAVAALAYRTDSWPAEWRPTTFTITDQAVYTVAGVAAALALLMLIGVVVNGRRWHTANVVKRLSEDPAFGSIVPDTSITSPPPTAASVRPVVVRFVKPQRLRRPRTRLRRVSQEANVIGRRPLHIAYLRVFENQPRTRTFIEGAWREFGYVYFLRSAWAVTPDELRSAKRSGDLPGMFIATPQRMQAELDSRPDQPNPKGRYRFRRIGPKTIRVRDRYGSYPVRPVLCHGTFWKQAVDVLLQRVDVVALDLSGYRPTNAGTRYELQRVLDRVPVERLIFLADRRSKRSFLANEVQRAWLQMSPSSPNAGDREHTAIVAVTDYYRTTQTTTSTGGMSTGPGGASHGAQTQSTQVRVRLVARRRQTRRLVAMCQDRVEAYAAGMPA